MDMLSVNQTMVQVKLTEAWKASKDEDYPVKMKQDRIQDNEDQREVRLGMRREMKEGEKKTYLTEI